MSRFFLQKTRGNLVIWHLALVYVFGLRIVFILGRREYVFSVSATNTRGPRVETEILRSVHKLCLARSGADSIPLPCHLDRKLYGPFPINLHWPRPITVGSTRTNVSCTASPSGGPADWCHPGRHARVPSWRSGWRSPASCNPVQCSLPARSIRNSALASLRVHLEELSDRHRHPSGTKIQTDLVAGRTGCGHRFATILPSNRIYRAGLSIQKWLI